MKRNTCGSPPLTRHPIATAHTPPHTRHLTLPQRKMADAVVSKTVDQGGTRVFTEKQAVMETLPHAGLEIVRSLDEVAAVGVMQLHRKLPHLPPSAFSSLCKYSQGLAVVPFPTGQFDPKTSNMRSSPAPCRKPYPRGHHTLSTPSIAASADPLAGLPRAGVVTSSRP